jgi:hypothetical protein
MAQQEIDVGTNASDGTGDPLRVAFTKVNENFAELYGFSGNVVVYSVAGRSGNVVLTVNDVAQAASESYVSNAVASSLANIITNTLTANTATITNDVVIGGNLTIVGNIAVNNAMTDRGTAGSNWDTITQMGTYVVNKVSWSGTTGTPLDSLIYIGLLEVSNSANTAITQNYRPYDSGAIASVFWTRSKFNTTWSSWREMINNTNSSTLSMDGGTY